MQSLEDWSAAIDAAAARIKGRVARTELRRADHLSAQFGVPIWLKLENRQITGAFKLRGATNALLALDDETRSRGVTTASTGNHGRALAHAARAAGTRCVVHISSLVPGNKVAALKEEGAEIRVVGRSQDEADVAARALARDEGLAYIPPFDHADVIAGQGTIGREILEDLPEPELVLLGRVAEVHRHPPIPWWARTRPRLVPAPPSTSVAKRARRRYTWARHSQVLPMPPWTWMAVSHTERADRAQ